jgi:hypothetical protein
MALSWYHGHCAVGLFRGVESSAPWPLHAPSQRLRINRVRCEHRCYPRYLAAITRVPRHRHSGDERSNMLFIELPHGAPSYKEASAAVTEAPRLLQNVLRESTRRDSIELVQKRIGSGPVLCLPCIISERRRS